jgi:hypothetical protein
MADDRTHLCLLSGAIADSDPSIAYLRQTNIKQSGLYQLFARRMFNMFY